MLDVRYADDCAYVVQAPSFDRLLRAIEEWATDTGMTLHPRKSLGQFWGRRRMDTEIWHPRQYGGDDDAGGAGPNGGEPTPGQTQGHHRTHSQPVLQCPGFVKIVVVLRIDCAFQ